MSNISQGPLLLNNATWKYTLSMVLDASSAKAVTARLRFCFVSRRLGRFLVYRSFYFATDVHVLIIPHFQPRVKKK